MMRKFLVVDEHPFVRRGYALSIGEIYSDAEIFEAGSLVDALALAEREADFTLVLFGLELDDGPAGAPGEGGARRLIKILGQAPLLVVSTSDAVSDIVQAVRMGASGYLLKSGAKVALEHAVKLALAGATFLPLPRNVLSGVASRQGVGGGGALIPELLTGRQRDVFQLLLVGQSNKEIARALGVLEGTVKVHVRAIMQKLGVHNRTQVAVVAARRGCLPVGGADQGRH